MDKLENIMNNNAPIPNFNKPPLPGDFNPNYFTLDSNNNLIITTELSSPNDITTLLQSYALSSGDFLTNRIVTPTGDYVLGSSGSDLLTGSSPTNMIIDPNTGEVLYSEGGNDTLIGGAGDDKYIISDNGGTDTIIDSDGQVYYKNYKLANAYKQANGAYEDERGNVYSLSGDTLTVTNPGINSQVQINDFNNGNLGIYLHESSDMPVIDEEGTKVLVNVDGRSGPWDVNVNPLYSYGGGTNFLPPTAVNALTALAITSLKAA